MASLDGIIDAATQIVGDAAAPYALFSSAQRYIGTLVFDVTVREVHSDEFTITVHPVETGTPVSDHIFANPKIIEIVVGSSDSTAGYEGRVQEVYEGILALANSKQLFDVATGKRFYQNMAFGNITVVTDETSEFTLMATFRLQELILTSTQGGSAAGGMTADNQASPADTAPETEAGTQTAQPIGPSATLPSFAQSQQTFGAPSFAAGAAATGTDSIGAISATPSLATSITPSFAQI